MSATIRAIGYGRVSSYVQLRGTSLNEQKRAIELYAQRDDVELIDLVIDGNVKGEIPLEIRPCGKSVVEAIDAGKVDVVVVTKIDRAFRSASDCLTNAERWEKLGVFLVILDYGGMLIDTRTPGGKFFLTMLAGAAEFEKNMIKERTASGRAARKAEGRSIGGCPYGLTKTDDNFLVPNQKEQEVIQIIKELKAEGWTARSIAMHLNDRGIKSKKGRTWQATQVIRILEAA